MLNVGDADGAGMKPARNQDPPMFTCNPPSPPRPEVPFRQAFPSLLAVLVLLVPAAEARSQRAGQEARGMGALDVNQDGQVSESEFTASSRMLERLDLNGDGVLDREDRRLAEEKRAERSEARFKRLDLDGDGQVTADELAELQRKRFAKLDRDQDGFLSEDEQRAARKQKRRKQNGATAARRHQKLDADGDGAVTREEFFSKEPRLGKLRLGEDGSLDRADIPAESSKAERMFRMFDRLDENEDGTLSSEELQAARERRFEKLDRDGDGSISKDEASSQGGKRGGKKGQGGRRG